MKKLTLDTPTVWADDSDTTVLPLLPFAIVTMCTGVRAVIYRNI